MIKKSIAFVALSAVLFTTAASASYTTGNHAHVYNDVSNVGYSGFNEFNAYKNSEMYFEEDVKTSNAVATVNFDNIVNTNKLPVYSAGVSPLYGNDYNNITGNTAHLSSYGDNLANTGKNLFTTKGSGSDLRFDDLFMTGLATSSIVLGNLVNTNISTTPLMYGVTVPVSGNFANVDADLTSVADSGTNVFGAYNGSDVDFDGDFFTGKVTTMTSVENIVNTNVITN
jgi:hypothetical protein